MPNYQLSKQAHEDLRQIWLYGAKHWGTTKADIYVTTINEMCIFLADNQNLGIRKDEVTKGLKSYPINSHVVFYIRQNNKIYIIRFLHKKMDYQQHLVN